MDLDERDEHVGKLVVGEDVLHERIAALGKEITADYAGRPPLLIGVLKGAFMFMADFAREMGRHGHPVELEFMAISSYGQRATSSGVVRILKDLDRDIAGRHVIVVEDVVDSGLTLSWLLRYLSGRGPASLEVVSLVRKPEAMQVEVPVKYVGFDLGNEFVVGYGMDYAEKYRELPFLGVLKPEVYSRG